MEVNKKIGFTSIEMLFALTIIIMLAFFIHKMNNSTANEEQMNNLNIFASRLNTAARLNYYSRSINNKNGIAIKNCNDTINTLSIKLPSSYTITPKEIPVDTVVSCTLNASGNLQANFHVRGIE